MYEFAQIQGIKPEELKAWKGQFIKITGLLDIYQAKKRCFTQVTLEDPAQLELLAEPEFKRLLGQAFTQQPSPVKLTQFAYQPSAKAKPKKFIYNKYSRSELIAMDYYKQGIEFTAQDNHHAAIECYNQALNINSNMSDFYRSRGNAYFYIQDYQSAQIDYRKALHLNPSDKKAEYNLSVTLKYLKIL